MSRGSGHGLAVCSAAALLVWAAVIVVRVNSRSVVGPSMEYYVFGEPAGNRMRWFLFSELKPLYGTPAQLLSELALVVPLLWLTSMLLRRHRARRRAAAGLCPACGYDVRSSPERCPECGAGHACPRD